MRAAAGLSGELGNGDWRYDIAFSGMQTNLERTAEGALYFPNLMAAIRQGTYNFVNPDLNTDAIRDFIAPTSVQRSNSKLVQVQANIARDLFELPGGVAQGGISLAYRYEALDNPSANSDALGAANRYLSINPFGASGSRDVQSAAFEVDLPFLQILDVNVSGRYDTYSTGQSDFSPKIGVRFTPFEFLAFRGTYSEGFRIPSFAESFADPSTGFTGVNAPAAVVRRRARHRRAGQRRRFVLPRLRPRHHAARERRICSRRRRQNINLGFVLRPFDNWVFSADYLSHLEGRRYRHASAGGSDRRLLCGQSDPGGVHDRSRRGEPELPGRHAAHRVRASRLPKPRHAARRTVGISKPAVRTIWVAWSGRLRLKRRTCKA